MAKKKTSEDLPPFITKQNFLQTIIANRTIEEIAAYAWSIRSKFLSMKRLAEKFKRELDCALDQVTETTDDAAWCRRLLIERHGYKPGDIDRAFEDLAPLDADHVLYTNGVVGLRRPVATDTGNEASYDLGSEHERVEAALDQDLHIAPVIQLFKGGK